MFAKHIHNIYTCVGVVYMLGKHIHALKLPVILIVIPSFWGVCICLAFNSKKKVHTCNPDIAN